MVPMDIAVLVLSAIGVAVTLLGVAFALIRWGIKLENNQENIRTRLRVIEKECEEKHVD